MNDVCTLHRGTAPLLISLPHDGSELPPGFAERLVPAARSAPDTDWFVSRLYDFARELGASILVPRWSRYVVDLNRPQDDVSLYPGQNTTGLCTTVMFNGEPLYLPGAEPSAAEIQARIAQYWQPYHRALGDELVRIKAEHGRAVLWEGHSIRGVMPFLFEGRLPDINLGTADGRSCSPALQARLETIIAAQSDYTWVVNGRFKGGHITRHYGQPEQGVDAIQMELVQATYMDEDAVRYDASRASKLQPLLRTLLAATLA